MSVHARSTHEQREAERQAAAQAKLDDYVARYPTDHPHLLRLTLDGGLAVRVECPGREHCGLWYEGYYQDGRGRCGVELEAAEVGSEFLEWQVGPRFQPTANPIPIGFTWVNRGEGEPPEIEWWPHA